VHGRAVVEGAGSVSEEQRVRTEAGWIGVEISKSRVRTPGRVGYGLYRVRGSMPILWSIERSGDIDRTPGCGEPTLWTPYAFTLEDVETAVREAINRGAPDSPGDLRIRQAFPGKVAAVVPTRWTAAYTGRRDLGVYAKVGARAPMFTPKGLQGVTRMASGREAASLGEGFEVPCENEREPDGDRCVGTVGFEPWAAQGRCDTCGGWVGRQAPSTVRSRQRAANNAFQAEHLERRAHGLVQRHAAKQRRNDGQPECGSC
jgi:hypothetical protein